MAEKEAEGAKSQDNDNWIKKELENARHFLATTTDEAGREAGKSALVGALARDAVIGAIAGAGVALAEDLFLGWRRERESALRDRTFSEEESLFTQLGRRSNMEAEVVRRATVKTFEDFVDPQERGKKMRRYLSHAAAGAAGAIAGKVIRR